MINMNKMKKSYIIRMNKQREMLYNKKKGNDLLYLSIIDKRLDLWLIARLD